MKGLVWKVLVFLSFSILPLTLTSCSIASLIKPSVVINSPFPGSQFQAGEEVAVQSTATDVVGIARVELIVDGNIVKTDQPQGTQTVFTVTQTWTATPGPHTISVVAFNTAGTASNPATFQVAVLSPQTPIAAPTLGASPTPAPTQTLPPVPTAVATPKPIPAPACTNLAAFVADVTVPDGTVLAPGQAFNKIWRIRNTGSCVWGVGYLFVFTGGTAMGTINEIAVPNTAPGATADLLVPMTAPSQPGLFTSFWRLRGPDGALFGSTVWARIRVPAPAPTIAPAPPICTGTPVIEFFSAFPTTITAGQSATLSWGLVSNADRAVIDQGIGGVATPGSTTVSPGTTTTYTLTGFCGANTAIAQVTIFVIPAPTAAPAPTLPPPQITTSRCPYTVESGSVSKTGAVFSEFQVGDDASNNAYRAFFSYELGDLAHTIIDSAVLTIGPTGIRGDPFSLGSLRVETVQYRTLTADLFDAPGVVIATIGSGPSGRYDIRSAVQTFVNAGSPRFQLRLSMASNSNDNGAADLFVWPRNLVCISITRH